ncbi:putative Signal transduction histidine kinase [Magnetospirillum sp. LM-5]|uniref:ATP-binding protein n=1 Tax=Magnetospirillum sp. LM-5 TaxID=2681466 RepID=UPI001380BE5B|nr:ATP-binding protein [Magnetospirillum sp. LM-5]CAA7615067.1 putative Signal transduction histidine kinase [Magnetospirillum sp. LM-5]
MAASALGNLKDRLLALVLLGVAPAMMGVAILVVAVMSRDARHDMAQANVANLVRMVTELHDTALESTRVMLASLVTEHDFYPDRCADHLSRVVREGNGIEGLVVIRANGSVLCGSGRGADIGWMTRLPAVLSARESGQPAVGPYLVSADQGLSVPMAMPVDDQDGKGGAILVGVREFPWSTHPLIGDILPASAHMLILDQSGTVRHAQGGDARIGVPAPVEALARAVREGRSGVLFAEGEDGRSRIFAFDRLSRSIPDLFVVVSVPEDVVVGPIRDFFLLVVGAMALVAGTMVVVLMVAGRQLVFAPTARLLAVIREVQAGNRQARAGSVRAFGELNQIANAFDDLLDELDQREARFRDLFDQSPDAILVHDLSGNFVDANTSACRLTGFSRAALLTMDVFALVPAADRERLFQTWSALQPGRPVTVTGELRREDGVLLPTETFLAPLGSGVARQVVAVVRDVSAQARARRALEQARDQAEQASRAKSDFLANMSHELRTPLNAVIGFGETMRMEMFGPLAPKYREYAQDIVESGTHLLELITDILDLAKIEAGRMDLAEEPVRLGQVVGAAVKLLRGRADAGAVTMEVRLPATELVVMGDPRRLKQVLINLISNAVKFTPSEGCVTVAVGFDAKQGIEITVTDTGIGMAPEDIPRAMEPFGQVGRNVTSPTEGTGLGLALVRGIVETHGGSIAIDSEPGRGTAVTVRLPAARVIAS